MGVLSFTEELECPVSAARLFKAIVLDGTTIFPKLAPDVLLSGTIVQGDGGSGTIKDYHFNKEAAGTNYSYVRELHYVIDKENLVDKWTWSEGGDMGTKLVSYDIWCKFVPTSNGGCIYKYGAEYEPIDGIDYIEGMKIDRHLMKSLFKVVEVYSSLTPMPMLSYF